MAEVPGARVLAFFKATRTLSMDARAELVGRTTATLRRWRAEARKEGAVVSMEDDAAARIEEQLGGLPPVDVDAYRQGIREAIRHMEATIEQLKSMLSARDAAEADQVARQEEAIRTAEAAEASRVARAAKAVRAAEETQRRRPRKRTA